MTETAQERETRIATARANARKTRELQYVNGTAIFKDAASQLGLTHSQLSSEIGYSPSAHTAWFKENRLPKVATIAIEALKRRRGDNGAAVGEHYVLIHMQDQRIAGHRVLTKPNKLMLNGQSYLLIPDA